MEEIQVLVSDSALENYRKAPFSNNEAFFYSNPFASFDRLRSNGYNSLLYQIRLISLSFPFCRSTF